MLHLGRPLTFPSGTNVRISFNAEEVFQNAPAAAIAFSAAIAAWSWAEHWYANLRAMLELNDPTFDLQTFSTFNTTPPELRALYKAIERIGDRDIEALVVTAIRTASEPSHSRNGLAHGIIGHCQFHRHSLLVFRQEGMRQAFREGFALIVSTASFGGRSGKETEDSFRRFVQSGTEWTVTDLRTLNAAASRSAEILRVSCNLCSRDARVRGDAEIRLKQILAG